MKKVVTNRITIDPDVCNGKPVIKDTRIPVHTVLDFLSAGDTVEEILKAYPALSQEDVQACITYASQLMDRKYVIEAAQ